MDLIYFYLFNKIVTNLLNVSFKSNYAKQEVFFWSRSFPVLVLFVYQFLFWCSMVAARQFLIGREMLWSDIVQYQAWTYLCSCSCWWGSLPRTRPNIATARSLPTARSLRMESATPRSVVQIKQEKSFTSHNTVPLCQTPSIKKRQYKSHNDTNESILRRLALVVL